MWRVALVLTGSVVFVGSVGAAQVSWQQSQSVRVQVGVRDKTGSVGSYQARFVVTAPDGKRYEAKVQVRGDDWGYATFPDDFHTYAQTGSYGWVGVVNGHTVAGGQFAFSGGEREASITADAAPGQSRRSP